MEAFLALPDTQLRYELWRASLSQPGAAASVLPQTNQAVPSAPHATAPSGSGNGDALPMGSGRPEAAGLSPSSPTSPTVTEGRQAPGTPPLNGEGAPPLAQHPSQEAAAEAQARLLQTMAEEAEVARAQSAAIELQARHCPASIRGCDGGQRRKRGKRPGVYPAVRIQVPPLRHDLKRV